MSAYQINAPHFCAGVETRGEKIIRTAPILKYMRGWKAERMIDYCREKGWTVVELGNKKKLACIN